MESTLSSAQVLGTRELPQPGFGGSLGPGHDSESRQTPSGQGAGISPSFVPWRDPLLVLSSFPYSSYLFIYLKEDESTILMLILIYVLHFLWT